MGTARQTAWIAAAAALVLLAGCGGKGGSKKEDPILRLSAAEALAEGRRLMAEKKYNEARKYLIHAFEVEPNSADGRDGLIAAADAMFLAGGYDNKVEAETRYRDFLNRFPTSDRADYAQFRIAQCLAGRMEKADRDQATTRKALAELEDLIRLYPTSPYAAEAREELRAVNDKLAEHELKIASFYLRYGCGRRTLGCISAAQRLEYLLDNFPQYPQRERVLFKLCGAYRKIEEPPADASDACTMLAEEFPNSSLARKLPDEEKLAKKKQKKQKGSKSDAPVEQSVPDLAADDGV